MFLDAKMGAVSFAIIDLIILSIVLRFKGINVKQFVSLLFGNVVAIIYFNWQFPDIPLSNFTPVVSLDELLESDAYSQWIFAHQYITNICNSEMLFNFILKFVLPGFGVALIGFVYTLGFKKHQHFIFVLLIALLHSFVFFAFPIFENLIWQGLVFRVNLPFCYCIFLFYIIGFGIAKLILKISKKHLQ